MDDPTIWIDPFGLAKCHTSGDLGNAQARTDLTADGFTIVAREVTMEVNGSRMRADFVASKNGKIHVFEAKNKKVIILMVKKEPRFLIRQRLQTLINKQVAQ